MKQAPHSMATICGHDCATVLYSLAVNRRPKISVQRSRADHLCSCAEGIVGCADQVFGIIITFAYEEGLIQICMKTSVKNTDVQIYNVAFLQWPTIWNTVTDHFIRRHAYRLWKTIVVQWAWIQF